MISFKCISIVIIILMCTKQKNFLICMCVYFKEIDFKKYVLIANEIHSSLAKFVDVVEFQL